MLVRNTSDNMAGPIPWETKERLIADPFMKACCLCGAPDVQWHHNLIYGGAALQEWWSILPVCRVHHRDADKKDVRSLLNRIMRKRSGGEIERYEKVKKFI